MASRRGMALRNEAAQGRINVALAVLVAEHDDLPAQPTRTRDPLLDGTLRLEWIADTLERLAGLAEPAQDGPEGPNTGQDTGEGDSDAHSPVERVQLDRTELKERKLDELKALALDAGADEEAVNKARSKDEVLDLFEAQINGEATVGDPFSREALLETDLETLQILAIATGIEDDAVEAAEDDGKEALVALIVEHPRFQETVEQIDHLDATIEDLSAALAQDTGDTPDPFTREVLVGMGVDRLRALAIDAGAASDEVEAIEDPEALVNLLETYPEFPMVREQDEEE